MHLLISLCNKVPVESSEHNGVFLIRYHLGTGEAEPVRIADPKLEGAGGVRGMAAFPGGVAALFHTLEGFTLVFLDHDCEPLDSVHLAGVVDGHSVSFHDGHFYVVSTGTDSIIRFSPRNGEDRFWSLGSERDTVHLNALAWLEGELFVTAFGPKKGELWKSADDGYVMRVADRRRLMSGLHHPHSLLAAGDGFLLCESSRLRVRGSLGGELTCDFGYIRGLAAADGWLFVGSGKGRNKSRSTGLTIDNAADPGPVTGDCGLGIYRFDGRRPGTAEFVGFVDLGEFGDEIYDILVHEADEGRSRGDAPYAVGAAPRPASS